MVEAAQKLNDLPPVRGRLTENAPLGAVGWFKAGGTADVLFKPADMKDLREFLLAVNPSPSRAARGPLPLPMGEGNGASYRRSGAEADVSEVGEGQVPLHIFGVMSNCIIRDGGVRGVTIRLPREFAAIEVLDGYRIRAGALALDASVAKAAAEAGIAGLEFLSGIPGTIGGALRMNAGCYGTETKDVLVQATAIDRHGNLYTFTRCHPEEPEAMKNLWGPGGVKSFACLHAENTEAASLRRQGSPEQDARFQPDSCLRRNASEGEAGCPPMDLSYRHNTLSEDFIFLEAIFEGQPGDPETIKTHMDEIRQRRESSQPIRERTGGSTFANPKPEEIAEAGLPEGTKVWQLIDRAGCRGLMIGGAQMSEKHCNFMINTGNATAADLENLGEEVRRRVYENCGITLRWEIKRIGEPVK